MLGSEGAPEEGATHWDWPGERFGGAVWWRFGSLPEVVIQRFGSGQRLFTNLKVFLRLQNLSMFGSWHSTQWCSLQCTGAFVGCGA